MQLRHLFDLVLLAALWGASFLFMRVAAPEFGPVPLIALRVVIAGMFLLPITTHRGSFPQIRQHWWAIFTLGTMNSALPFTLLAFSTLTLTGGFTAILNGTTPLWGALIAWFWLNDRLTRSRVLGLVVGFAGIIVLIWPQLDGGLRGGPDGTLDDVPVAIVAGTIAAFLYAVAANFTKKRLSMVGPLALATGTQVAAALLLVPLAIVLWPAGAISLAAWASVIVMGVASTGIAHILYFRLISNIGPASTMTVTYMIPMFAMLWGALFIGERVTLDMLIGTAIILSGTALATGLVGGRGKEVVPKPPE